MTPNAPATRRRYDNSLRRERAAQTRNRIIDAADELLRESSIRDWDRLTIRSVAERARVNQRTVFRHFTNERLLRDAVMRRQEDRAGVDLDGLQFDGIGLAAEQIFRHVASYPRAPRALLDPTLADASKRQHEALLRALQEGAGSWPEQDRRVAAAMFDVLWAVSAYERLVVEWDLESDQAIGAITWVIDLLKQAVAANKRPTVRARDARPVLKAVE